eukprot:ctg_669.g160
MGYSDGSGARCSEDDNEDEREHHFRREVMAAIAAGSMASRCGEPGRSGHRCALARPPASAWPVTCTGRRQRGGGGTFSTDIAAVPVAAVHTAA